MKWVLHLSKTNRQVQILYSCESSRYFHQFEFREKFRQIITNICCGSINIMVYLLSQYNTIKKATHASGLLSILYNVAIFPSINGFFD